MTREQAAIQVLQAPGLGPARFHRLVERLKERALPLESFVTLSARTMAMEYGLAENLAEGVCRAAEEAAELTDVVRERGARILLWDNEEYPARVRERLGTGAPPVLYAWGATASLRKKCVAFAGARDASEAGIQAAEALAGAMARRGAAIVAGYARGVDLAAHAAAMREGGATVAVLPDGILHFGMKIEAAPWANEENFLALSSFPPRVPWSTHNAMARNAIIAALAGAMIAVEPGAAGGTLEAGRKALSLNMPLFVIAGEAEPSGGVRELLRKGAVALGATDDWEGAAGRVLKRMNQPRRTQGMEDMFDQT